MNQCKKCHGLGYYDEGHENDDGSMSGGNYVNCEACNGDKAMNQCNSCGGFCKKSGCERENTQPNDLADLLASIKSKQQCIDELESQMQGLSNEINDFQNTIEKQRHVMNRAIAAWDSTTHQKNGDGRLWQCMEELRAESHNAENKPPQVGLD